MASKSERNHFLLIVSITPISGTTSDAVVLATTGPSEKQPVPVKKKPRLILIMNVLELHQEIIPCL